VPARWGWVAVSGAALVSVSVQLSFLLAHAIFGPRGMDQVLHSGWAVGSWWVHRGAWLRTRWGRPDPGTPAPWDEPTLTTTRAWWYVWLGAACLVAAAIAVSWQARAWVS
jgi:hypothetical protein